MSNTLRLALEGSSSEERSQLLAELAREALSLHAAGPYPVRDANATTVGYLTPTADLAALIPTDPEWVAEMRRRVRTAGRTHSPEEFLARLNAE